MAKFYCAIGFSIEKEVRPGVWINSDSERNYSGEIIRNSRKWDTTEQLNDNLNISNQFSIVADSFIKENIGAIRYIVYMGTKWKISNISIEYPRLILTTGGVYNNE
ncbi:MAG: hypothetical protein IJJ10_03270 [Bacillus sp. (in: Bacteria)]|nr:hypothetical protein [Bacillus sp. (in: firmicutes)]